MTDKVPIDRSVIEQALDALQDADTRMEHRQDVELRHSAMAALRAALEQQQVEQEPVAWLFQHEETGLTEFVDVQQVEWGFEKNNPRWQKISPVYTHPQPPRQPLTDQQIHDCFQHRHRDKATERRMITRAIERAHGIGGEA